MTVDMWDFRLLSTWATYDNWYLDPDEYISAPSCLLIPMPDVPNDYNLVVYDGTNHDLPEGRVDFYLRNDGTGWSTETKIFLGVTDAGTYEIATPFMYAGLAWVHFRITWWYAYDNHNNPSTRVKVEHEDAGDWIEDSTNDYPPLPSSNCRYAHSVHEFDNRDHARIDNCSISAGVES